MSYNNKKTIGILGGMGAEASADLYKKIINYCQSKYGAKEDYDYPPIILYNLPANGFCSSGIRDKEIAKIELQNAAKILEKAGADFIVIPCNTAHYFIDDMRRQVSIPILSLIEVTLKTAAEKGLKKLALLSSASTRDLGIYTNDDENRLQIITVSDKIQSTITGLIGKAMAGTQTKEDRMKFKQIVEKLLAEGADGVVLGCTELPLLLDEEAKNEAVLDTLDILAKRAVTESFNNLDLAIKALSQ